MLKKAKLLLAAVVALVALAGLTSSASAVRLQTRNGGAITSVSLGRLTFEGSGLNVRCNVTLRGSLRTEAIEAVRGTSFGSITAGEVTSCEGGSAEISGETFPWSITYNTHSVAGGLEFTINGATFLIEAFGSGCQYRGSPTATLAWTRTAERTFTSGLIRSNATSVSLLRRLFGLFNCPSTGRLIGSFNLTPTQTITEI
jgi:hypothetical protein